MQMRIVQFFYFNEHVHQDTTILYSEKQHCTTFNHLLLRGRKKMSPELWKIFEVSFIRS